MTHINTVWQKQLKARTIVLGRSLDARSWLNFIELGFRTTKYDQAECKRNQPSTITASTEIRCKSVAGRRHFGGKLLVPYAIGKQFGAKVNS